MNKTHRIVSLLLVALFAVLPVTAQTITAHAVNSKLKNNLEVTGTLKVDGPTTLAGATPVVTTGNANGQVAKARVLSEQILSGTASNTTTYKIIVAPGRACTLQQVAFACTTAPIGSGSFPITVQKNGSTNMLNAVSFDGTGMTANTASLLSGASLSGTPANLQLAATDTVTVSVTTGTQTTACQNPSVSLEFLTTDY